MLLSSSTSSTAIVVLWAIAVAAVPDSETIPDGYYAFMEAPLATPPRVRRPPYTQTDEDCPGVRESLPPRSLNNLCGDLNKGVLPKNPMGQNVMGSPYPFELLRNKTLKFLSRTLPILKEDETLPKVARFSEEAVDEFPHNSLNRKKREDKPPTDPGIPPPKVDEEDEEARGARKFCEKGGGVLCMLYKAFNGEPLASGLAERREDVGSVEGDTTHYYRRGEVNPGPPTPCPARVEYATPVFAKNYQGVWRYVVQIPYEGYFTQTVEVVRCLQSRCYYLDGGCLSSPRWTSLLVAEIYYPDTVLPLNGGQRKPPRLPVFASEAQPQPPPVHDFQNYQQYLRKRAGTEEIPSTATPTAEKPSHCDGVDDIGCFQVRLYYDWFLIPGSCKCWRSDYFSRYIRRKVVGPDL